MAMILTPKGFLKLGGIVLILVGILGFAGIIGPMSENSIFGNFWWFDNAENWAHLILGIVGLVAAFVLPAGIQKMLVMVLGIVGIIVGVYSLLIAQKLGPANLENPADTVLHLVVGVWALVASMKKPFSGMMSSSM